jgi:hypothetical protein
MGGATDPTSGSGNRWFQGGRSLGDLNAFGALTLGAAIPATKPALAAFVLDMDLGVSVNLARRWALTLGGNTKLLANGNSGKGENNVGNITAAALGLTTAIKATGLENFLSVRGLAGGAFGHPLNELNALDPSDRPNEATPVVGAEASWMLLTLVPGLAGLTVKKTYIHDLELNAHAGMLTVGYGTPDLPGTARMARHIL